MMPGPQGFEVSTDLASADGPAGARLTNRARKGEGVVAPDFCTGVTLASAPIDYARTALTFVFPATGGLLFGYDVGATSGAIPILENPATSGVTWGRLMTVQSGIATSTSLLGAMLGSVLTFAAKDKLGRKTELLIAACLYGVGSILSAAAVSFPMLLVGRVIYGMGFAFALHGAPAYLAEAGHPRIRGFLISMKEIFIGLGIELGYLVSLGSVKTSGGWRIVFGVALLPAIILFIGMLFLPESPRWLLLQGRPDAAKRALRWSRGKYGTCANLLEAEYQDMADMNSHLKQEVRGLFDVFQRRYWWPLMVGLSLMFFQQVTGQPSVLYYATKMFEKVGVSMGEKATGIAGVLGAWKLLVTGIAVVLVDRSGRRPLLLTGVAGMCAAALVLGISGLASPNSSATAYLSIAAIFCFTGFYQISFGPISWLIVGEVFPLAVRGAAISLATLTNFATNWVVALVLPSIEVVFRIGGTFLGFACMTAISWVVIFFIVPETRGKTLEDIEMIFSNKHKPSDMAPEAKV